MKFHTMIEIIIFFIFKKAGSGVIHTIVKELTSKLNYTFDHLPSSNMFITRFTFLNLFCNLSGLIKKYILIKFIKVTKIITVNLVIKSLQHVTEYSYGIENFSTNVSTSCKRFGTKLFQQQWIYGWLLFQFCGYRSLWINKANVSTKLDQCGSWTNQSICFTFLLHVKRLANAKQSPPAWGCQSMYYFFQF